MVGSGRVSEKRGMSKDEKHQPGPKEATKRHVYVEPGVQIDIVKDLKARHDAEREEDKASHQRQRFWIMVSTLLVFAYTLAMGYQAWLSRATMQTAQRAWVGLMHH
jgi:hypothetical protein